MLTLARMMIFMVAFCFADNGRHGMVTLMMEDIEVNIYSVKDGYEEFNGRQCFCIMN